MKSFILLVRMVKQETIDSYSQLYEHAVYDVVQNVRGDAAEWRTQELSTQR